MSLGSAIYSILRADATVLATFGNRIYPIVVPQSATAKLPAITYQQTGIIPNDTKKQYSTVWNARSVNINIYAQTYNHAETYAEYVQTALIRYEGTIGGETIKSCVLVDESFDSIADFTMQGDEKGVSVFVASLTFNIVTQ